MDLERRSKQQLNTGCTNDVVTKNTKKKKERKIKSPTHKTVTQPALTYVHSIGEIDFKKKVFLRGWYLFVKKNRAITEKILKKSKNKVKCLT